MLASQINLPVYVTSIAERSYEIRAAPKGLAARKKMRILQGFDRNPKRSNGLSF
jgi:hypothetical protein